MKRSANIRLVLLGGLALGGAAADGPSEARAAGTVFTNQHFSTGKGYYHAPYRNWYAIPYNHYDPARQAYFHGGRWTPAPHSTITNISPPLNSGASSAGIVSRGGFGRTGSSHYIGS